MKEKNETSKLRILFISQHYAPEPFPAETLCRGLATDHEVHVLTGVPNYPEGEIYPGYEHGEKRKELLDDIPVERVFTVPRRKSLLFRVLNYYSFALSSCLHAMRMNGEYDCVLVYQSSPVMMAYAGILYAWKHGIPLILYCADLWPLSLKAGGIPEHSLIWKHYRNVSARVYRSAHRILITSEGFRQYLRDEFGIPEERIRLVPQCGGNEEIHPAVHETMNLLYAGNIGMAQNTGMIADCAEEVQRLGISDHGRKICFQIVGSGSCASQLEQRKKASGLADMHLYGRISGKDLVPFLEHADAGIVTLSSDNEIADVIPAKYQTCLSAGLPMLANDGTAAAHLMSIQKTGIRASGLSDCLLWYLNEDRKRMAETCRRVCQSTYSLSKMISAVTEELRSALEEI
ncbi:MAG: glycosyltransferase family 4 protein [Solobacterium sp.]|nr:glycosyltransferase family 4 protein [Solobacterium sp.]